MSKPLSIGAFAAVQYLPHIETFLATGDGDFDGPIWAKATSEIKFVDGRASFTMVHEFMSRDGSRSLFCQLQLSALELDDTRKPAAYIDGPRHIRFSVSAG